MDLNEDIFDLTNRKKRRGIIEKRRRDRINNSLAELKRLVPLASEKESNAKLEKAEILQLTVEYLKCLQKKGKNIDDDKASGFRDCILEVSRYLVNIEGFDLHHPLRLRILSHLQTFTDDKTSIIDFTSNSLENTTVSGYKNMNNPSFDYISSSSSCSASPKKFETNMEYQSASTTSYTNKKQLLYSQSSQNQQSTQFLNNSAFVQINITANNRNSIDTINEWQTTNSNLYTNPNNLPNAYINTQPFNCSKSLPPLKDVYQTNNYHLDTSSSTYWNQSQLPVSKPQNHYAIKS